MHLTIDSTDLAVLKDATSTALDNEHDKGDEGLGLERMGQLQEFLDELEKVGPDGGTVEVSFMVGSLLIQYLASLEGFENDRDEMGPEHGVSRESLLRDLEAVEQSVVIARSHSQA